MADQNWQSQQAGRSSAMYDPSRHNWHEFQIGRMQAQQEAAARNANNSVIHKPGSYEPPKLNGSNDGGDGGGLLVLALVIVGFVISVVSAVLSVFGALVMKLMARLSGRGSMTYVESYVASFYTIALYGAAMGVLYGAFMLYRTWMHPTFPMTSIWYRPLWWKAWQVIAWSQPIAFAAAAGALKWNCPVRYAGFTGYLRAYFTSIFLLLLTIPLTLVFLASCFVLYMLATRGIHDTSW